MPNPELEPEPGVGRAGDIEAIDSSIVFMTRGVDAKEISVTIIITMIGTMMQVRTFFGSSPVIDAIP